MTSPINNAFTVTTAAFHVVGYQLCGFFSALLDLKICTITYNIAVSSAWLRNDGQVILTEVKSPFWRYDVSLWQSQSRIILF